MKLTKLTITALQIAIFVVSFTLPTEAQDYDRRIRPAYPIGAGEKMLVIPSTEFNSSEPSPLSSWSYYEDVTTKVYHIALPVGTVLKRIVVEAMDKDGSDSNYLIIDLRRLENSNNSQIALRSVSTYGHNTTGFDQFVSNPMSHGMLQGWTYFLRLSHVGNTSGLDFGIGVIKIIYEP